MVSFDALPPALRHWLSQAVLPWSVRSVRRAWRNALRASGGDPTGAARRLTDLESRRLRKDAVQVWGPSHPAARPGAGSHESL